MNHPCANAKLLPWSDNGAVRGLALKRRPWSLVWPLRGCPGNADSLPGAALAKAGSQSARIHLAVRGLALSRRPWSLVRPRTVAKPPNAPQAQTKDQGPRTVAKPPDQGQCRRHPTKDFSPSPLLRHGLQGRRRGKPSGSQESRVKSQESGTKHAPRHQARRKAPTRKFRFIVKFPQFPLAEILSFSYLPI